MKEPLVKTVKDFLSLHIKKGDRLVLGFSGGVDSSALLSLLSECLSFFDFTLHVAHFDHAWRLESEQEADKLQQQVESQGFVFHRERSQKSGFLGGNKEERARHERYEFLEKIYHKVGASALILAHQKEDQAETVLKRIFEGASLLSLGGMQPASLYKGMKVVRPLISVSRKDLEKWNFDKKIPVIIDHTNEDLQFLRPRMREKLFPELEKWFGKGLIHNLSLLGEEILSLKNFIEPKTALLLEKKVNGPWGFMIALQEMEPFEQEIVIRHSFKQEGLVIGRKVLQAACQHVQDLSLHKYLDISKGVLLVDRGHLFWFKETPPVFSQTMALTIPTSISDQGWTWCISKEQASFACRPLLDSFLQGEIFCKIPSSGPFFLCSYEALTKKDQNQVSSFFAKSKIPVIMRKSFPFIIKNGSLFNALNYFSFSNEEEILSIKLKKT